MFILQPILPSRPAGLRARLQRRVRRGFTLVEVMIATMVFTMGILGVYAMMIKSYQLVTLSRHRDNARAPRNEDRDRHQHCADGQRDQQRPQAWEHLVAQGFEEGEAEEVAQ